jgi:hypothetical protein
MFTGRSTRRSQPSSGSTPTCQRAGSSSLISSRGLSLSSRTLLRTKRSSFRHTAPHFPRTLTTAAANTCSTRSTPRSKKREGLRILFSRGTFTTTRGSHARSQAGASSPTSSQERQATGTYTPCRRLLLRMLPSKFRTPCQSRALCWRATAIRATAT